MMRALKITGYFFAVTFGAVWGGIWSAIALNVVLWPFAVLWANAEAYRMPSPSEMTLGQWFEVLPLLPIGGAIGAFFGAAMVAAGIAETGSAANGAIRRA